MTVRKTRIRPDAATVDAVPPYSLTLAWDPDDRIFVVTVPELPGCRTHGATYEEAAANAREAIALWVEVARDHGDVVPEPRVVRHPLDEDAPVRGERVSA